MPSACGVGGGRTGQFTVPPRTWGLPQHPSAEHGSLPSLASSLSQLSSPVLLHRRVPHHSPRASASTQICLCIFEKSSRKWLARSLLPNCSVFPNSLGVFSGDGDAREQSNSRDMSLRVFLVLHPEEERGWLWNEGSRPSRFIYRIQYSIRGIVWVMVTPFFF